MQQPYSKLDKKTWGQPGGTKGYPETPKALIQDGMLARPDGHNIHYHEYGNPNGSPVMFFHGGPGGGSAPDYSQFFDPEHYRVILFDQRGCGKSTPNVKTDLPAALTHNTTQDLIEDAEALRKHLKVENMQVFGGSWGTTLALAYAEAHPEHVTSLVLRGIFTCTKRDIDYFYQGNAAQYDAAHPQAHTEKEGAYRAYLDDGRKSGSIPPAFRDDAMALAYAKAWKDYVEVIPPEKRDDMVAAYHEILNSKTLGHSEKLKAATAWSVWEGVTSNLSHDTSPAGVARFADPDFAIAFAAIENHYFYNGAFLDGTNRDQQVLTKPENIKKIAHIPVHIVHGMYDQVCPVYQARNLLKALGKAGAKNTDYHETECGHSMFERLNAEKLVQFTDNIRDQEKAINNPTSLAGRFAKKPQGQQKGS